MTAPLCDAGRCSQLLTALAEAKQRMVASQGDQIVAVLTAALADLGVNASEFTVRMAVIRSITRILHIEAS